MAAQDSLRVEALSRGSVLYVRLYGAIDESFNADTLVAAGEGKDIIINARNVARISSFGVRQWVNTMGHLATVKNSIVLYDCSPVLVRQLNMVQNFAANCNVLSIRAPYYCGSCSWDTEVELTVSQTGVEEPDAPVVCKRCKGTMELDEDPASYFRFASRRPFIPLDRHIVQFMRTYVRAGDNRQSTSRWRDLWERLRGMALQLRHRPWVLGGVAAGLALLLVVVALLRSGTGGIPAAALQTYHHRLAQGDFAGAETAIDALQKNGTIPAKLAASMHREVAQNLNLAREHATEEGQRAFAQRHWARALTSFGQAETLGAKGASLDFYIAQCNRRLGKAAQASERYARFLKEVDTTKHDRRLDDALFWRANYLAKDGHADAARPLLQQILNMSHSNYRHSARRLLRSLGK